MLSVTFAVEPPAGWRSTRSLQISADRFVLYARDRFDWRYRRIHSQPDLPAGHIALPDWKRPLNTRLRLKVSIVQRRVDHSSLLQLVSRLYAIDKRKARSPTRSRQRPRVGKESLFGSLAGNREWVGRRSPSAQSMAATALEGKASACIALTVPIGWSCFSTFAQNSASTQFVICSYVQLNLRTPALDKPLNSSGFS